MKPNLVFSLRRRYSSPSRLEKRWSYRWQPAQYISIMNELWLAAALEAFYQQVTAKAASRGWPVISREVFWRLLYGERDSIPRL